MYLVSREKSDLKADFEGGKSLSVDWYQVLRRAADRMLGQVYPNTLKRAVSIYGGFTGDLFVYYCPTDVLVPAEIYSNDGLRQFTYVPPNKFYRSTDAKQFTLEYINGVRFLVARHKSVGGSITLDSMEGVSNKTATGVTLTLNSHDVLFGTYTVQGTFTSANNTISGTFTSADITAKLWGIARLPINISTAANVSEIELRLHTSNSDYFSMSTDTDATNDNLVDGWNMLRFDMANRTETGSPDSTDIIKWSLVFTLTADTTIILDELVVQETEKMYLEYISNRMFVDQTTKQWKDEPESDNDQINLDRDSSSILHYEAARIIGRKSIAGLNFTEELAREYGQYWEKHPSDAQPLSYNISSEVGINAPTEFDLTQAEDISAEIEASVSFMNGITPTGTQDGVNTVFTLPVTPDPASSLQLFYNGQYQTSGVDFTLSGSTITMSSAPAIGVPFIAYFQY
jgi:hypothetical protein